MIHTPTTVEVLEALGYHLTDLGLARYNPNAAMTEDPIKPLFVLGPAPATPNTTVSVTPYNDDRSRDKYNPDYYIQLRFRAAGQDLRVVERLADKVFAELDWEPGTRPDEVWPGGVRVQSSRRTVRAPSAPDGSKRFERADSYRITVNPGE